MKIILVLLIGIAIFAFFKISGILLKKVSHKYAVLKRLDRMLPVVQVLTWTIFVFWANGVLFRDRIYYPYIVTGMAFFAMALAVWFFLRDVVAGLVFRSQNDLMPGENIQVGAITGQVRSVHLMHIVVATDNGSTIKIPNTHLSRELISGSTTPEGLEEFKIQLSVNKQLAKPEIEEKIRNEVANSPWCDYKLPPIIKLKDENDSSYVYDVVIYTLNHQHLRIVEKALKEKFENIKS